MVVRVCIVADGDDRSEPATIKTSPEFRSLSRSRQRPCATLITRCTSLQAGSYFPRAGWVAIEAGLTTGLL